MTVIAWDGKTLAADRRVTFNGTPFEATKIFLVSNGESAVIYGAAGSTCDANEFHRWIIGDRDRPKLTDLSIIAIDEGGIVYWADSDLNWAKLGCGATAIGSGGKFALGAMKAGKSARDAVEIAIMLDVDCGNGIDTLDLR